MLFRSIEEAAAKEFLELKTMKGETKPKYTEFMSYAPHNNNEIAIPTWTISKPQLKKVSTKYIIA